jgi:thiol-disulfide isomerase/thioredoxin
MKRMFFYALAILAMASGALTQRGLNTQAPIENRSSSSPSLNASFIDLEGKLHNLTEWKGKVLVVNFWASWCPPCIMEMPDFIRLQNEYGDQGLQFVGLITGDNLDAARRHLQDAPVNYPVLNGEPGANEWSAKLGNNTDVLPLSAVFDRNGKLIHMEYGLFRREEVLKIITPLL